MPKIETTFVDLTSIVPAAWFNLLQKHLAGFLNLKVTVSGTSVQVEATDSDGVASAYIGGEMRRNDTTVSHTFVAEGSGTYNVYVVATAAVDTFAVEVSLTTPVTSPYRKVAEVDWDGVAITALRGVRGRVIDHTHDGVVHPKITHSDLTDLTSGDPHTQYMLPDGSRPFTGVVSGVAPTTANHLATKEYADSVLRTVPIGGIFWWPSANAAPNGFLLADGAAVSRVTYDKLFDRIGTTYGVGDGTTTFNLPDLRGRMVQGASVDGDRNAKGGALTHSHTQPTHTHTQDSHSHTTLGHTHTGATTGSGGDHTHTQGVTGSDGDHAHTGPSHTHSGGLSAPTSAGASVGSRNGSSSTSGLYPEVDLDNGASSTSHSHGDGSYYVVSLSVSVTGTSASASKDHFHPPAGNAYEHTHGGGSVSGSTGSAGTGTWSTGPNHTHTNPTTASGGSHTHASGGDTGSASPSTNAGGDVATGAGGGDVTGTATAPFLTLNALIRYA